MWFLGAGTSRSAGLPTSNDIIWDLKLKYYCAQENQDVKAHDVNNKADKNKIQRFPWQAHRSCYAASSTLLRTYRDK